MGNNSRKSIIVAKNLFVRLNLMMAYRVIFVYNRNYAVFNQCGKGVFQVITTVVRFNILLGQKRIIEALISDPEIVPAGIKSLKELYGNN